MQETQIRGMHASGAVHHNGTGLVRIRVAVPISRLSEELIDWTAATTSGDLNMIAHARYSTSDMEFHQPLGENDLFMAHNGVITQEPPETWEDTYGYNFALVASLGLVLLLSLLTAMVLFLDGVILFDLYGVRTLLMDSFTHLLKI